MDTDARIADAYARLDSTARGEEPNLLVELPSGYAVFGDDQHLPGYCLLLHRDRVEHLDDLPARQRIEFLADMALLGEAVRAAATIFDPGFLRVNYEVLGNSWPHLHAHVFARYAWEPRRYRQRPVWLYPPQQRPRPPGPARLTALQSTIADLLRHGAARARALEG